MRALAFSLLLAAALASQLSAQAQPQAEPAVRAVVEQFAREFREARDPAAVAALFRQDGEVTNLAQGWTRRGRAELEQLWTNGFERHRSFSRDVQIQSIRLLAPNVALVDGSLERGAGHDASGQPVPPWREHFTMILTEQGGRWAIAAARSGGWNPVPPTPESPRR